MANENAAQQPKQKGKFWKILLKVIGIGIILSKAGVIRGTVGGELKKVDPEILEPQNQNEL